MQEKIQKKFIFPLVALAIVGVLGTVYTIAHSGSSTVHAQTATVQADKKTKDDVISPKPSMAVQQKADINENEKADANNNTEKEDGN